MCRGVALCEVSVDRDAEVTATEIEQLLPTVSRHLVYVWRRAGKLEVKGRRGRSPLYRWGDVVDVERETRTADPASQRARQFAA